MSKLTEYLTAQRTQVPRNFPLTLLVDHIEELLPTHDAATREQAQREQYEACCRANCIMCERGNKAVPSVGGIWVHQYTGYDLVCQNSAIHNAHAKAQGLGRGATAVCRVGGGCK